MPLRGLFYFARLYSSYVETHHLDVYSKARLKVPTPRYIVFYNGTERDEERMELRLSASFEKKDACLECTATVININFGQNQELMKTCRKLYEYAFFVCQVRQSLEQGMALMAAIDEAVSVCIREEQKTKMNALFGFLLKENRLDDLRRACEDREYEEALLKEYNL